MTGEIEFLKKKLKEKGYPLENYVQSLLANKKWHVQPNAYFLDKEMPKKDVYICNRCGYVLPKKDAVVSGWDAEHSSTHVHCPRCGKIIARYVK